MADGAHGHPEIVTDYEGHINTLAGDVDMVQRQSQERDAVLHRAVEQLNGRVTALEIPPPPPPPPEPEPTPEPTPEPPPPTPPPTPPPSTTRRAWLLPPGKQWRMRSHGVLRLPPTHLRFEANKPYFDGTEQIDPNVSRTIYLDGRQNSMAVRRAADEYILNGTAPSLPVLIHALAWAKMDAPFSLHGDNWTNETGRFPDASHVMCALFFALADLRPIIAAQHPAMLAQLDVETRAWRDQAEWLVTGGHPTFLGAKRHHNAVTSALSVLCAADAALDQSKANIIAEVLSMHIEGTITSGNVNKKERDRLRAGHYGGIEIVTILHCLVYLRNIGGEIRANADAELAAYIRFLCPHLWAIVLADPTPETPYLFDDALGQIKDTGRVSISHHATTIEWAMVAGFETGVKLPTGARGKSTPYKSFAVTPS